MRLFLAVTPPEAVVAALERLQDDIPVGRIVPSENLHLTLAFLGEVAERDAEALHDALSDITGPRAEVSLKGLVALGDPRPRVIAAGAEASNSLAALHHKIRGALHVARIGVPRARFRPHVTLARLPKVLTDADAVRVAAFLAARGAAAPGAFVARALTLFRSHLGREGSIYEPLADYPLD